MVKYLTTRKIKQYQFSSIKLVWMKTTLAIWFEKDGYLSETFVALQCLKFHESPIENIFLIGTDENKCIIKELLWGFRLKNFNYSEFIDYLTNAMSSAAENSSGNFLTKESIGLELRFPKTTKHLYPTVSGCEINFDKIHEQIRNNRYRNLYL